MQLTEAPALVQEFAAVVRLLTAQGLAYLDDFQEIRDRETGTVMTAHALLLTNMSYGWALHPEMLADCWRVSRDMTVADFAVWTQSFKDWLFEEEAPRQGLVISESGKNLTRVGALN